MLATDSFEHRVEVSAFARDQSTRRAQTRFTKKRKKRIGQANFLLSSAPLCRNREISKNSRPIAFFLHNRVCLPPFQFYLSHPIGPIVPIVKKKTHLMKLLPQSHARYQRYSLSILCVLSRLSFTQTIR
mgnify:CR=1 FL=1